MVSDISEKASDLKEQAVEVAGAAGQAVKEKLETQKTAQPSRK